MTCSCWYLLITSGMGLLVNKPRLNSASSLAGCVAWSKAGPYLLFSYATSRRPMLLTLNFAERMLSVSTMRYPRRTVISCSLTVHLVIHNSKDNRPNLSTKGYHIWETCCNNKWTLVSRLKTIVTNAQQTFSVKNE
jgi:hypothetical protein